MTEKLPLKHVIGSEIEFWATIVPNRRNQEFMNRFPAAEIGRIPTGELIALSQYKSALESVHYRSHNALPLTQVGTFLDNGGRSYVDMGTVFEISTPEVTSIKDLPYEELRSQRLLYEILTIATQDIASDKGFSPKQLEKFEAYLRVVAKNARCGYHLNLSFERSENIPKPTVEHLTLNALHMFSNQLFCGSGGVINHDDSFTYQYVIAQKLSGADSDEESATMQKKPVFNIRDEPLADQERYGRLHITSADPTASPLATMLKAGSTELLLRMTEADPQLNKAEDIPRWKANQLHLAARQIARNPEAVFKLGHNAYKAIDIQELLLEKAIKYAENHELTKDQQWTLNFWQEAVTQYKTKNYAELRQWVDWMRRKDILEAIIKKHYSRAIPIQELSTLTKQQQEKIHEYDWLVDKIGFGDDKTFSQKARQKPLWREHLPTDSDLKEQLFDPPKKGRGVLRASLIKRHKPSITSMDWHEITLTQTLGQPNKIIRMDDPASDRPTAVFIQRPPYLNDDKESSFRL